jgi:hypothetical protein
MAISITDLMLIYSGPAVTTPIASIGGAISTGTPNEVRSQSVSGVSTVTGVSVVDAYGNIEGVGTLQYLNATDSILWYPPGTVTGSGKDVAGDGTYTIGNSGGYLIVDVTYASLPTANQQDSVTVTNIAENIFDNVTEAQSLAGNTEYRCFYIENNHATLPAYNVTLWVSSQPTVADTISLALDSNGLNGTALGPLNDTEDTTDVLSGLTFTTPTSQSTGLDLGTMAAGDNYPFWIKKVTPIENRFTDLENKFSFGLALTSTP